MSLANLSSNFFLAKLRFQFCQQLHWNLCRLGAGVVFVILLLAFNSSFSTHAAVGAVDSFDADHLPFLTLTYNGTVPLGPIANSSTGAGVLGGERDIEIEMTGVVPPVVPGLSRMTSGVASSIYVLSVDSGIIGSSEIQWDGADGSPSLNPTGLGGVDLTNGGLLDAFQLSVVSSDVDVTLTLSVYTDGGNFSTYNLFLPDDKSGQFVMPFDAFVVGGGSGADFRNVGAVTLTIPPTLDLDMRLDALTLISTEPPDDDDDDEEPPEERPRYPPPSSPPQQPPAGGGGGGGPLPTTTPIPLPTALPPPSFPITLPETGSLSATWWSFVSWPVAATGFVLVAGVGLSLLISRKRK